MNRNLPHTVTSRVTKWLKRLACFVLLASQSFALANEGLWTGEWDTRWPGGGARVSMTQEGDRVIGTFPLYDGKMEGTVSGRVLQGLWWQGINSLKRDFLAVLAADGQSFAARIGAAQWATGVRVTDNGISLGFEVNQSTPYDTLHYFLLIMNSIKSGTMEAKSEATHLIDWSNYIGPDISRLDYTELLFSVLDRLTISFHPIKRTTDGERYQATLRQAGTDFNFMLDFVKRDDRWYIESPSVGSLEAALKTLQANRNQSLNRKVADFSSPRDSLKTLMTKYDESDPDSINRVITALDLTELPELSKRYESKRLASYVKRAIERIGTPVWQEIPDDPKQTRPFVFFDHPVGTITLQPIQTDTGIIWQFTPETLRNIRSVYNAIDDLPLNADAQSAQPERSAYFKLRDFFGRQSHLWTDQFGPMALWQWMSMVLVLALAYMLGRIAVILFGVPLLKLFSENLNDHPLYQTSLIWSLRLLLMGITLRLVDEPLGLPDMVEVFVVTTAFSFIVISITAMLLILVNLIAGYSRKLSLLAGNNVTLVSLVAGVLRVVLVVAAILVLADLLEIPYESVIAGLGIGGLAVALAAQSTLQNFIAGITLYFDKPIAIGDYCSFGTREGTVEFIGMRSTRIRTLDRTLVTVPNSEFSNLQIENYAKRDRIFLKTTIQVRYETTPDQLRYLLVEIKRLLIAHPKVAADPLRVRFDGFGEYSLNIDIFAYVLTNNYTDFLAIKEDLFLHIMDLVDTAGVQFAFPSMVHYEAQDTPYDPTKVQAAEAQVKNWRELNNLPFPDFSSRERAEISSTLQYPPAGSAVAHAPNNPSETIATAQGKAPAPDFPEQGNK